MPKKPKTLIESAMAKVAVDSDGYSMFLGKDDPARRLPPLPKSSYAYQIARKTLIPDADAHAKMWARRSPESPDDRERTHMQQLAFANQMQRLAFENGLISYDPTKTAHFRKEADLLAEQQQRAGIAPGQLVAAAA